jgi:hypothetical protein
MIAANPYLDRLRALKKRETGHPEEPSKPSKLSFEGFEGDQGRLFFEKILAALEGCCAAHVAVADWRQAIDDGRRFVSQWGERAEALGWTNRDLFGLSSVPEKPAATYRRLSRYDMTGLIWLLRGRPVVAMTEATAKIQGASGAITVYRKDNKPALGPVGDSLRDLDPRGPDD